MKTIKIEIADEITPDIQWFHGVLYKAFNQPMTPEKYVDIKDHETISVTLAPSYSDVVVMGEQYKELERIAKEKGMTVAQMIKELGG